MSDKLKLELLKDKKNPSRFKEREASSFLEIQGVSGLSDARQNNGQISTS